MARLRYGEAAYVCDRRGSGGLRGYAAAAKVCDCAQQREADEGALRVQKRGGNGLP
ncbi:hypothetical protein MCHI_001454 [Candidatus Magnetoovum chiemensis]|nr:hypothetical protein MCHI_001454 [Candidatus Magnetoovum chiemensis]